MKLPLDAPDLDGDPIQRYPRLEIAEVAGIDRERLPPGAGTARQHTAERLADDLAEGPAGASRLRFELGRHVVIQCERCSHVVML
jgi:hypothetical protein